MPGEGEGEGEDGFMPERGIGISGDERGRLAPAPDPDPGPATDPATDPVVGRPPCRGSAAPWVVA